MQEISEVSMQVILPNRRTQQVLNNQKEKGVHIHTQNKIVLRKKHF
jgi:hypothetical protein